MSAKTMEDVAALLKNLHFRKKLIGGVDEADVWRQLDMLQKTALFLLLPVHLQLKQLRAN